VAVKGDPEIEAAKTAILERLHSTPDQVYYATQLAVLFERKWFHWITHRAVRELVDEDAVRSYRTTLLGATPILTVTYHGHRNWVRPRERLLGLVRQYSQQDAAKAIGRFAETLWLAAMASRGFVCHGRDTREFRGIMWKRTDHRIDLVLERDGIVYGVEVKNTWPYIPRDELQIKIELCQELKIRPLFILRSVAKTYLFEDIQPAGGGWLLFGGQLYPPGQEALVERIKSELGMPAVVLSEVDLAFVDRFLKGFHEKIAPRPGLAEGAISPPKSP
jgi:hypothetical protein